MKYSIGDKVKIKSNLSGCTGMLACDGMKPWRGKEMTINYVETSSRFPNYFMEEDGRVWRWTDEMIECKVTRFSKSDLKVGYTVKLHNGEFCNIDICEDGLFIHHKTSGFNSPIERCYEHDLTHNGRDDFNIEEVYGLADHPWYQVKSTAEGRRLLWQREPATVEITILQIAEKFNIPAESVRIKE